MDIIAEAGGPFGLKFHQVAMYTDDPGSAMAALQRLGFKNWVHDDAVLRGLRLVAGTWVSTVTVAQMAFNYQVSPLELEFLTYVDIEGEHRHHERARLSRVPFISHMGVHVASVVSTMQRLGYEWRLKPVHVFVTEAHTNPKISNLTRFVECVYDTRDLLGFDIKCIERVPWDYPLSAWDIIQAGLNA